MPGPYCGVVQAIASAKSFLALASNRSTIERFSSLCRASASLHNDRYSFGMRIGSSAIAAPPVRGAGARAASFPEASISLNRRSCRSLPPMKKGYADRVPTARLAQLLPQQRLYSSPDAQAGIIATDFSSVDIQMSIMNRHPTDQEEKAVTAVPAGATTFGAPSAGSFPVDFPEPVRRQGGGGSSPGPSGS